MPTGNSYFPPFWGQEDLLWILLKIGGDICVHNMHVENKVHPFLTEVLDQKLSGMLIFHCFHWLYFGLGITCCWVPPAPQKTTFSKEGVVDLLRVHEGLSSQVCNPVLKLIVTRHDKATIFSIQSVGNGEPISITVKVPGYVWRFDTISE